MRPQGPEDKFAKWESSQIILIPERRSDYGFLVGLLTFAMLPLIILFKLLFSRNPLKSNWLPVVVALGVGVWFHNFWWVWVPVWITITVVLVIQNRRRRFVVKTLAEIDSLNGPEFERYVDSFFRARGCEVVHTGRSGDFGADLIVVDKGVKYAVQAKNYDTGDVNNKAVQEAFTAASYYGCTRAMVVTNAQFTDAARELARKCKPPVLLMGRDELTYLLKRMA
ncbi:MAG: restriction endonuclease [Proteobacteria bacterium]|nr:restriction endonuclease [Pseudomonadota bacterium]